MNKYLAILFLLAGSISAFATEEPVQQTLSIIKPDGVRQHHIGDIVTRFEKEQFRIAAMKMVKLTEKQAEDFYAVHKGKPFFPALVKYMSSGPIVAIVLEKPNAVSQYRELMGATDPKKALPGTLRADFAASVSENAVHGSDSLDNARQEILFFFKPDEIF